MATIKSYCTEVSKHGGSFVILERSENKLLMYSLKMLQLRTNQTVKQVAKSINYSRAGLYALLDSREIELNTFLKLQRFLKCQILNERDINLYTDYLKSLLIIP